MSDLIDRLKSAHPDDPRGADELTLEFGQWAEQNQRSDIFDANPDFAAEYRGLRNSLRQAQETRSVFGQLRDAGIRGIQRTRQTVNVLAGMDEQNAQDIASAQKIIDARPASPESQEFSEQPDPGLLGSILQLVKQPKVAIESAIESLPQSLLSMGGGALGTFAGGVRGLELGPVGTAISGGLGAASGSGAVEYASKILGVLQEAGMDIRDPDSIQQFFADESLMAKARELAVKRAIPVAAFDGATFALAGTFVKPLQNARAAGGSVGLMRAGRAALGELGLQAAGGAAGERLGQISADEPYSGRDVAMEAMAEIASGPMEVFHNMKLAGRGPGVTVEPTIEAGKAAQPQTQAPAAAPVTTSTEDDAIAGAARAAQEALKAVDDMKRSQEAANLLEQQQAEINRRLAALNTPGQVEDGFDSAASRAQLALAQANTEDQLSRGLAMVGADRLNPAPVAERVAPAYEPAAPAEVDPALAMAGATARGQYEASPIAQPDAGMFDHVDTAGVTTPFDEAVRSGPRVAESTDAGITQPGIRQVAESEPSLSAVRTQGILRTNNPEAVPAIAPVATLTPTETIPAARSIRAFDDVALPQSDRVAEIQDFAKDKSSEYTVAAILQDNQTGKVYQRGVRRGAGSELTVEMAQNRKGAATGSGQGRAANADLEYGTVNRPIRSLLSERVGDQPRFSVIGYTVLDKPQKSAAVNFGTPDDFRAHPDVKRLVKAGYDQAVIPARTTGRRPGANKKTGVIEGFAKAGDVEVTSGLVPEAAASMTAPQTTITPVSAPLQMLESIAADVAKLGRDEAVNRAQKLLTDLARNKQVKGVELNPEIFRAAAESLVDNATALTIRPSAANLTPDVMAPQLFTSALQSVRDAGGDVAIFEKNVNSSFQAAQQGWGIITDGPTQQKMIGLGVESLGGNHDGTVKLLHEVGHLITDGLPESLRRAFHLAIDNMHWSQQKWVMHPLATELRVLANTDIKLLSPEQLRALSSFTPEEIARARQIPREELQREKAAEHLAMLGVDKAQAKSLFDRLIRTAKDMLLRIAIAMQQAFKGENQVSDRLAKAYVENQYLSFIHGDVRALSSLSNWVGAPSTGEQRVTAYESLSDGDYRIVSYDPVTHDVTAPDISSGEQLALRDKLQYILGRAEQFARGQVDGTDLTKRGDVMDYTPGAQFDSEAAAINLQEQHLRQIFESESIGPMLPKSDNPFRTFISEWLGLPEGQWPETRRQEQANVASTAKDPLTGQPVSFTPTITVDQLPSVTEKSVDDEGRPVTKQISSAQDNALRQTLRFLQQTENRLTRKLDNMNDRIERLQKQADKKTLSEDGKAELDELNRQVPLLTRVAVGEQGLRSRIREIESRLGGAEAFSAAPGADFPVPTSPNDSPEKMLANRKTIPRDLQFADRAEFFSHIVAIRDWLDNPKNKNTGRTYGYMKDVLAKLQDLAVTPDYVANTFRLRRTMAKSIPGKLRDIGTAVSVRLAKPFLVFQSHMNRYQQDSRILGTRWSSALQQFADSMGEPLSEAFLDRHWNHLMRALESINEGAGNPFDLAEQALVQTAGMKIGEKQRAALRHLIMETRANEKFYRDAFESMGLKVADKELKGADNKPLLRKLISQGYVTGRRTASRHLVSMYQQMNPTWSETGDTSFFETAGLQYAQNRGAYDASIAQYFPSAVIRDFVEPLALNNANHFNVTEDGGLERAASLSNVRKAWRESKSDVTRFAELLHGYEGLPAGQEARTVGSVMKSFATMFSEVKRDSEDRLTAESNGLETTPRQMMDARLAGNWPAEWVSYATFDANANLRLLHQLAVNAAFGRDGFGPSGEFTANLNALRRELQDMAIEEDRLRRDLGLDPKAVEKKMGADRYRIAQQVPEHLDMLNHVEEGLKAVTKTTGYLIGDFRLLNEMVSFSASMALQNPRSALLQAFDILAPFYKFKLSGPAFRAFYKSMGSLGSGLANSVLQSVGANFAFNAESATRRHRNGYKDPEVYTTWRQKLADRGFRLNLAQPDHPETLTGRASRQGVYLLRRIRDLSNVGPTAKEGDKALGPKLRPGLFGTVSEAVFGASVDALYDSFADLSTRGIEWLSRMDPTSREKLLRDLESGVYTPSDRDLGYHRKLGVLNDGEALAYMKDALESKMWGERGLGQFIASSWRRKQQGLSEVSDHQFRQIANLAMTEWGLQSSIATSPHWTFTNPVLRVGMIFLTWPWNAMVRFGESFRDPRGRLDHQTILDGTTALLLGSVPLTLAGSLAFDWYDERVLGKKQNIRELHADKNFPVAALERVARYGSAGLASELLNQIVNYDTAKNLSMDNRVFAVNQLRNIIDAASTVVQQDGTVTYQSVGRPVMQAMGGSGLLHYLQVIDNLIPGVNNQDEAINRRINAGNYLRAAGRALDLDVRVFKGGSQNPTPITPWLQQMEAFALAGDNQSFVRSYQQALKAAREAGKEDPAKYVADAFADRHPLRRIFTHAPTAFEYRRILGQLDENGKKAVGEAVSAYNRQLQRLGKPAFLGRASTDDVAKMVRDLERSASGGVNTFGG